MSDSEPVAGAIKHRSEVQAMFGRIAGRYDLMNRIMTGWQDERWRRNVVDVALSDRPHRALDIATGTGDLALALSKADTAMVVGLDFAPEMVALAESKRGDRANLRFVIGDAMRLPFADESFSVCTVAFGLRNMPDYQKALNEIARILVSGGRFVCLELTPMQRPVVGSMFNWYFDNIVPRVGARISGDAEAYSYLPSSVAAFPNVDRLAQMIRTAGFSQVEARTFGAGTVAMHSAVRVPDTDRKAHLDLPFEAPKEFPTDH